MNEKVENETKSQSNEKNTDKRVQNIENLNRLYSFEN